MADKGSVTMNGQAHGESKTKVFLSYSRKDADFCATLAGALERSGYEPVYDRSSSQHDPELRLSAQDEWWKQLQAMIAASDVMIFVVSPDSASSHVCDDEVSYARRLGKRVIAILRRPIDFNSAPERLRALNVALDFVEDALFAVGFEALATELSVDIEWQRRGARLTRLAQQWESDGQPESQLLRAGAIVDADSWAARRPERAPEPGTIVLEFLDASRRREAQDSEERRRIVGRAFVKPAERAVDEKRWDVALRMTAAGTVLAEDEDMRLVPERMMAMGIATGAQSLLSVLHGHRDEVTSASFSPDGRHILTSSFDNTARIWEVENAALVAELPGQDWTSGAHYSSDGSLIVTTSYDCTATVWKSETGRPVATLRGHHAPVLRAAFSGDATRIVTACGFNNRGEQDRSARVWDAISGHELTAFHGHEGVVYSATFSPDGLRVLTCSDDGTARIWDAKSGKEIVVLRGPEQQLHRATYSPDGRFVLTSSNSGRPRLWDARAGTELFQLEALDAFASFSPDGAYILTKPSALPPPLKAVRIWTSAEGKLVAELSGHEKNVRTASFSSDSSRIVTASLDGTVRTWDAASGEEIRAFNHGSAVSSASFSACGKRIVTVQNATVRVWDSAGSWEIAANAEHRREIRAASFNPLGDRVLTASEDGTFRIMRSKDGKEELVVSAHNQIIYEARFSGDGSLVATASLDRTVNVWAADVGRKIASCLGHQGAVYDVRFSPDRTRILSASQDNSARIWNAQDGAELVALIGHSAEVHTADYSPDGARIVTASSDGTARIWDADGRQELVLGPCDGAVVGAVFSPDGSRILTWGSLHSGATTAHVWNALTGEKVFELAAHEPWVTAGAFSPDGRYIATADESCGYVWCAATGEMLRLLRGHTNRVEAVSFSSDSTRILSAAGDGTARIWDVPSGREIAVLRSSGYLSHACFSPNSEAIITASHDEIEPWDVARLWDVSRTCWLAGDAAEVLAASLTCGKGMKTDDEHSDILMQSAPDDLFEALAGMLSPERRESMNERARHLLMPFRDVCYLPPRRRLVMTATAPTSRRERRRAEAGSQRAALPSAQDNRERAPEATIAARKGVSLIWASLLIIAGMFLGAATIFLMVRARLI